jgi:NTE family protein
VADEDTVGLVLAGGGARGAYEAGAVSVLLPHLEARGERPGLLVGTSVGAMTAVYLASVGHLDAEDAVSGLLERWREVGKGEVIRSIIRGGGPSTVLHYAGEVLGVPRVRLLGLLDPSPLAATLDDWIDWRALHRNVRSGAVNALAVVTTAVASARSSVFVEGRTRKELYSSYGIDYEPVRIANVHVRASAAIPTFFPAVRIDSPARARGWYFDGGTRLNTPIKPVLDLGADRLVLLATDSIERTRVPPAKAPDAAPDFSGGAVELLQATLVDPLCNDVRMLGKINLLAGEESGSSDVDRYQEARGKRPYRQIPYIFVAPSSRGALGRRATEVFRDRYGGLKGLRSPDFALLTRLLGGAGHSHGELLSYLFFERDYVDGLIEMGRSDAKSWLDRVDGPDAPWYRDPVDQLLGGTA